MSNLVETARELALAWIAADQWGEPTVTESYTDFFYNKAKCSDELADMLIGGRTDLIIVRTLASKQVAQCRRALAFDPMPAKNRWPQTEEDGA